MSCRNIIFDIGNVLVKLEPERAFKKLAEHLNPLTAMLIWAKKDEFLKDIRKDQDLLETGHMTIRQFYSRLKERIGLKTEFEQFEEAWCTMFSLMEDVVAFARELSLSYSVYLASDTNASHMKRLLRDYPELGFVKGMALSYEIGALKPSREFFEGALAALSLASDDCLFIDDNEENIIGAREVGMDAIRFSSLERLREDLAGRGIELFDI